MMRIFSGIQPTGVPHLGNYLGAIKNWTRLQDQGQMLLSVVDLHAITVHREPEVLRKSVKGMAISLLACGVDPSKSVLFAQSRVPEHSELAWILTCHTPLGWLRRMTQFKSKASKDNPTVDVDKDASLFESSVRTGLFTYPALMASDILLYNTTHVPVGDDQSQHIELAKEIARSMNAQYKAELFAIPKAIISTGTGASRVMSLRDGRAKMSKSDPTDATRINLDDTPDQIAQKIKRATTDSTKGLAYDPDKRPEVANLLDIFAAVTDRTPHQVIEHLGVDIPTKAFKDALADALVAKLTPIGSEIARLQKDPGYVDGILQAGAERARALAQPRLAFIQQCVGLR